MINFSKKSDEPITFNSELLIDLIQGNYSQTANNRIEELIIEAFKQRIVLDPLRYLYNNGEVIDCDNIDRITLEMNNLGAVFSGNTYLYKNSILDRKYDENSVNNYFLISNFLESRKGISKYGDVLDQSLIGKSLLVKFDISDENMLKIKNSDDVYSYLDMHVSIVNNE